MTFGPKNEVTEEWRRVDGKELYSSSNITQMIKSRKMRWAGRVTRRGERSSPYRVFGVETSWKETTWKTQI
jgi:hypothetical protein